MWEALAITIFVQAWPRLVTGNELPSLIMAPKTGPKGSKTWEAKKLALQGNAIIAVQRALEYSSKKELAECFKKAGIRMKGSNGSGATSSTKRPRGPSPITSSPSSPSLEARSPSPSPDHHPQDRQSQLNQIAFAKDPDPPSPSLSPLNRQDLDE